MMEHVAVRHLWVPSSERGNLAEFCSIRSIARLIASPISAPPEEVESLKRDHFQVFAVDINTPRCAACPPSKRDRPVHNPLGCNESRSFLPHSHDILRCGGLRALRAAICHQQLAIKWTTMGTTFNVGSLMLHSSDMAAETASIGLCKTPEKGGRDLPAHRQTNVALSL
jgi:hypothetical protein